MIFSLLGLLADPKVQLENKMHLLKLFPEDGGGGSLLKKIGQVAPSGLFNV
jgi:hypothetical protein